MHIVKKVIAVSNFLLITSTLFGCGDGDKTNVPAVKLSASSIVSQTDATVHSHYTSIPFTDILAAPASDSYQYTSQVSNGHSHNIALSKQQMIDLNNGMRLSLKSSDASSGTSHTHVWNIQGGSVLYEKYCYNCHSNDNRGRSPMNVSFNSSQAAAVINPATAPASTSVPVIPTTSSVPVATVTLDGAALYTTNCASCHGVLATSSKSNKSLAQIKAAIAANNGGMASLAALTDAQLQAIAASLVK